MHRTVHHARALCAAGLFLAAGLTGCRPGDDSTQTTTVSRAGVGEMPAPSAAEQPSPARLLDRVRERWDLITKAGSNEKLWIEVYEFETPAAKQSMGLTSFLANKSNFVYDQAGEAVLMHVDGDTGWVNTTVIWLVGKHPSLAGVEGASPNDVQLLDMVETWKWIDGEWYFVSPPKRKQEFFDENPDFLRRAQQANAAAEEKP